MTETARRYIVTIMVIAILVVLSCYASNIGISQGTPPPFLNETLKQLINESQSIWRLQNALKLMIETLLLLPDKLLNFLSLESPPYNYGVFNNSKSI